MTCVGRPRSAVHTTMSSRPSSANSISTCPVGSCIDRFRLPTMSHDFASIPPVTVVSDMSTDGLTVIAA